MKLQPLAKKLGSWGVDLSEVCAIQRYQTCSLKLIMPGGYEIQIDVETPEIAENIFAQWAMLRGGFQ